MKDHVDLEGASLLDTIKYAQPNILLGLSGVGGLFTEDICSEMGKINERSILLYVLAFELFTALV